jgi:hypothetical protein
MSGIHVCGLGAVSPAGWGVAALRQALDRGIPIAAKPVARPGRDKPLRIREVPPPSPPPPCLAHPRLRRASDITHYAVAAAMEALGRNATPAVSGRLGLVMCVMTGCAQYSPRFFEEVLKDPATASPLLFPEIVFNAPVSHLAAVLGGAPLTYTLVGDPATFLQGVALAAEWLLDGRVEDCLVVGAEETSWLLADVLWHFDHGAELSGGAGALCLRRADQDSSAVALEAITDAHVYASRLSRAQAAGQMRRQLPAGAADELLCDGTRGRGRTDTAELAVWRDWPGARLSPKAVLGEGLMASGAWQCVAACDALPQGRFRAANVSLVGVNQQAIGARFARVEGKERE